LSSANSVCKHSYVLLFSAGISLTLFEKAAAVVKLARVEKIIHSRDSWIVWRNLQAGFSCL